MSQMTSAFYFLHKVEVGVGFQSCFCEPRHLIQIVPLLDDLNQIPSLTF